MQPEHRGSNPKLGRSRSPTMFTSIGIYVADDDCIHLRYSTVKARSARPKNGKHFHYRVIISLVGPVVQAKPSSSVNERTIQFESLW